MSRVMQDPQAHLFTYISLWTQCCSKTGLRAHVNSGRPHRAISQASESLYGARQATRKGEGGATERSHHWPPMDKGVVIKVRWPWVPVPHPVWPGIWTVTEPEFGEIHLKIEPNDNPEAKWESPSPWLDASKQREREKETWWGWHARTVFSTESKATQWFNLHNIRCGQNRPRLCIQILATLPVAVIFSWSFKCS